MNRSASVLTLCLAVASWTQLGAAATFSLNGQSYTTQYNTGSGADSALLVLEYGPLSYAFGYNWDPASAKSGYDMLTAVVANSSGNMNVDVSYFDFGSGPVPYVNTIGYLTNQPANNYPTSWLSYFTADDGGPWQSASVGIADRMLANGSADDWVHQDIAPDADFNAQVLPSFPISVPEPASLAVFGLGLALLVRRRGGLAGTSR